MINRVTKNDSWAVNPDGTLGYTCNLITGCLNHVDGICNGGGFPCFAYGLAHGRLKYVYKALRPDGFPKAKVPSYVHGNPRLIIQATDPFYPRFWPDRLEELDRWLARRKEPVGVFLNIMGEWAGDWVPEEWIKAMFDLIRRHPRHRFYILTKQPQNLIKWSPYPDNCWVGVTATNTRMALDACLKLGDIEAPVRFISLEPMLNPINIPPEHLKVCKIDQVIIGAQTRPKKMPEWDWVKYVITASDQAGTAVFLKYNLGLPKYDCDGGIPFYFKSLGTMELRQEVPHA